MVNSMLCSWLLNIIEPKLRMSIAYSDMTKIMWDNFKKRYATANTPKIHQLKTDVANCKQGDLDVGECYSKLVHLWNELSNLVKIPMCTCSGCKCEVAAKIIAMHRADKTHPFLMGLNDELYSTLRSQILALDPLPPLDRIFNMTQQEESHKKIMVARDNRGETRMAFAVKEQTNMVEKGACKICGQHGHEEERCYEVIGYPLNWGSRSRGRGAWGGRNLGRGGRSDGIGRSGPSRETVTAAVQLDSGPALGTGPTGPNGATKESSSVSIPGLSSDQIQRLLSLIDGPTIGYEKISGNVNWMLDSGASTHMAGDITLLNNVAKFSLVTIGLPNGTYTMASEQGSVDLGQGLALQNVLYVPKLNCNLVSISKLCK